MSGADCQSPRSVNLGYRSAPADARKYRPHQILTATRPDAEERQLIFRCRYAVLENILVAIDAARTPEQRCSWRITAIIVGDGNWYRWIFVERIEVILWACRRALVVLASPRWVVNDVRHHRAQLISGNVPAAVSIPTGWKAAEGEHWSVTCSLAPAGCASYAFIRRPGQHQWRTGYSQEITPLRTGTKMPATGGSPRNKDINSVFSLKMTAQQFLILKDIACGNIYAGDNAKQYF